MPAPYPRKRSLREMTLPPLPPPQLPYELGGPAPMVGRNPRTGQPWYQEPTPAILEAPQEIGAGLATLLEAYREPAQLGGEPVTRSAAERAGGASQALRGAMTLGSLALPAVAAAAPAQTLAGLVLGMGAQHGVEAGLREHGWQPGSSALAGDLAGLIAGGFTAKIPEATWRLAPGRFLRDQSGEIIIGPSVGWGSTLKDLIEMKMPAKASAEQVRSIMAAAPREEVQYSSLSSLLERNPVLTKEQVLSHLEQNRLPLTEVLRTKEDTKFRKWKTEHGKDYEELLLTMGEQPEIVPHPDYNNVFAVRLPNRSYMTDPDGSTTVYGSRQQAEIGKRGAELLLRREGNYQSGHWDEPNVLAHTRFQEHADMEGNPLFLVDEFQSDWHQAGRKEGYKPTQEEWVAREEAKLRTRRDVELARSQFDAGEMPYEQFKELVDKSIAAEAAANAANIRLSSGIPQAPFSKDWHEVMFKRMLTEAMNRGHDTLAWPKGKNVAERFNLRKSVDSLEWSPETETLMGVRSDTGDTFTQTVPADELDSFVGRDIAQKLKEHGSVTGDDLAVGGKGMEGFYDKIMVDYANKVGRRYGSKVEERQLKGRPTVAEGTQRNWAINLANEYAQQRYGQRLNDLPEPVWDQLFAEAEQNIAKENPQHESGDTVHAIKITPAMKNAVKRGLPLFGSALPDVATATGKSIKKSTK